MDFKVLSKFILFLELNILYTYLYSRLDSEQFDVQIESTIHPPLFQIYKLSNISKGLTILLS